MKRSFLSFITLFSLYSNVYSQQADKTQYVNPLIGTLEIKVNDAGAHSTIEHGRVVPIIGVPNGMTSWVPQTESTEQKCVCPYYYRHNEIQGFRASHWLNGGCTQDYGSFTIMPVTGRLRIKPQERAARFEHKNEEVTPSYYKVNLTDEGITARMTGLSHGAIFDFSFENKTDKYIVIDVNSDEGQGYIRIDAQKRKIYGYNPVHRIYNGKGKPAGFSGYFVIQYESDAINTGVWHNWAIQENRQEIHGKGKNVGAFIQFPDDTKNIVLKVGTSFTSLEAADNNLKAEIEGQSLKDIKKASASQWNERLGKIEVYGDDSLKTKFYSAFYMASILPRQYSDITGTYPAFATQYTTQKLTIGKYYDDFSMWDTYRALHPLYTIISPTLTNDFIRSLILKAEQGGWLPIFPCWNSYTSAMIGDHVITMIADAYIKGIDKFDVEKAYYYMRKNAFEVNTDSLSYRDGKGRRALDSYLKYGFIPMEDLVWDAFHKCEQVSRTLEYAHDDYALAQMAKKLNKTDDYAILMKRSENYKNVFDPAVGYVRGRYADKRWIEPFDPFQAREKDIKLRYVTEASPFQYTWYVPHDVNGLMKLMGGKEKFVQQLDLFFKDTHYSHSNEPSHHIAYLYAFAGEPWKTQQIIPEIIEKSYRIAPDGLIGNDDAGQMSAWLMMSMLGFYQVCPGTTQYVIGTPMFEKSVIHMENGKQFTITARNVSKENIYIQSATLNGKTLDTPFIDHQDIVGGGSLTFIMGNKPNKEWGKKSEIQ